MIKFITYRWLNLPSVEGLPKSQLYRTHVKENQTFLRWRTDGIFFHSLAGDVKLADWKVTRFTGNGVINVTFNFWRLEGSDKHLSGCFLFSQRRKFCYLPTNSKSSFFARGDVKLLNVKCRLFWHYRIIRSKGYQNLTWFHTLCLNNLLPTSSFYKLLIFYSRQ